MILFLIAQKLAHVSITITICKIYEFHPRNKIYSIPSIISVLPDGMKAQIDLSRINEFALIYGGDCSSRDPKLILQSTFNIFRASYVTVLVSNSGLSRLERGQRGLDG